MKIAGKEDVGTEREDRTIYVVEIADGVFVDVMHRKTPSDLIYVMDQQDGSIAYDAEYNALDTIPVNCAEIVNFISAKIKENRV